MLILPSAAESILLSFSCAFTQPTFRRMLCLSTGAILTHGRRTVTSMMWTMRCVTQGHFTNYHRVFSRASWSSWHLGRILAQMIVKLIAADQPVVTSLDDTTAQHRGKRVYGKGCHHDAVRSAHRHVVFKWGHKWVVMTINVKFPFASRPWALPVAAALYRPKELNRKEGRRHKTAPDLARQLMAMLIHWFPQRRFIFLGDGGYASHELARFCSRHARNATLVSRFYANANLYAPPPKPKGRAGRPRIKGRKLPSPEQVVTQSRLRKTRVSWFGGSTRHVGLVSGAGHWYKSGHGLVPVRWVFVRDLEGTHRDEYFYCTDLTLSPEEIVTLYTQRWPIETTFQEIRAHLKFETTRQWTAQSVLRTGPWLLGLYSVICLIFAEEVRGKKLRVGSRPWYTKTEPTFSDAIACVRRLFWWETILKGVRNHRGFKKIPPNLRETLLDQLCLVA